MYDYLSNSAILFLAYFIPGVFLFFIVRMIFNARKKVVTDEEAIKSIEKNKGILKSALLIWLVVSLFLGFYAPSHTPKRSIDVSAQEHQVEVAYKAKREESINSTKELKDRLRKHKDTPEEREDKFQDMVDY